MLLESVEKTISHELLLCLHLYFILFFSREERQQSCTKGGNIEQEMKISGACVTDVRRGEGGHPVPCKIFPCLSAIWGGCCMQENAQTGLS